MKGGRQGKTYFVPKWLGEDGKQSPSGAVMKPMSRNEMEYNRDLMWLLAFDATTKMGVMIKVPGKLFHRTREVIKRRKKLDELDARDKTPNGEFHRYQKECIIWLRTRRVLVLKRDAENFKKTGKRHRDKNYGNQLWDDDAEYVELIDAEFTDNGAPIEGQFTVSVAPR
jgi:hypothetical protein